MWAGVFLKTPRHRLLCIQKVVDEKEQMFLLLWRKRGEFPAQLSGETGIFQAVIEKIFWMDLKEITDIEKQLMSLAVIHF